jgi:hypothetical protein
LSLRFFLVLAVVAIAVAVATQLAGAEDYCEPGMLKIDLNGTVICVVEVEDYKPIYASFTFQQSSGVFNISMVCLYEAPCNVSMSIYDSLEGATLLVANVSETVASGGSRLWSFNVTGRGIAVMYVNDVFLGAFAPVVLQAPDEVVANLKNLASTSPYIAILAGLLIVSPTLGWMLQREWGIAGLALVGASTLLFTFVFFLTGDAAIASLVSVISGLIGLIYLILSGGGT